MTPIEILALIDELRARGATVVEVAGIKAVFPPAVKPKDPDSDEEIRAAQEREKQKRANRSLDSRLLDPLRIGRIGTAE